MPRPLAVLFCLVAVHATAHTIDGDSCASLWSMFTRLDCAQERLRDHVDALPLANGTTVHLRCTDDYSLCARVDPAEASPLAPFPASELVRSGAAGEVMEAAFAEALLFRQLLDPAKLLVALTLCSLTTGTERSDWFCVDLKPS